MSETALIAAAATPPSVGSASPSDTCSLEISCTAGHSRSMPSEAQSEINLATSAGDAGHKETPFSSHHLANIGAARNLACASATSTGLFIAWPCAAPREHHPSSYVAPSIARDAAGCASRN